MIKLETDYEKMTNNIKRIALEYFVSNKIRALVLGVSGGIDSTVTAALAREMCDVLEIRLIGMNMPTEFNKKEEIQNAKKVGQAFCDEFYELSIENVAWSVYKDASVLETNVNKVRRGNVAARIRMIYLYHMANYSEGLVLSTDNLTEYQLGFWTLHGDVGDYGLIQNLWKTEVYGIASFLRNRCLVERNIPRSDALQGAINAVPTDGLGVTKSDFDQLGMDNYMDIDTILIDYLNGKKGLESHPVVERHLRSSFKRINDNNIHRAQILG